MKQAVLFIGLIILPWLVYGQGAYRLKILDAATGSPVAIKIEEFYNSAFERDKAVRQLTEEYHRNGFLEFSADSIHNDTSALTLWIHTGNQYHWATVILDKNSSEMLKSSRQRISDISHKPADIATYSALRKAIVQSAENNGYPFAVLKADDISFNNDSIALTLVLDPGPQILFDSLNVLGKVIINKSFLERYLGLSKGMPYNESALSQTDKKLSELGFIAVRKPSEISFSNTAYVINIYPVKRNAGLFDGIIGFTSDPASGKMLLSGDVKLKLTNSFAAGESFDLNWKRPAGKSQRLKAGFVYPYMFGTKTGSAYNIDILQQDTTYMAVRHKGQLRYMYSGFDYISFSADLMRSSLLSTAGFEQITTLPPYAGVRSFLAGTGLHLENLDFRLNPSKGYSINIDIAGGQRSVEKHPRLAESLYDSITLKSDQYRAETDLFLYINPVGRHVVMGALRGGLLSAKQLFRNELFRIGGNTLLRGFDEEEIYASLYSVLTLEYRFLTGPRSYLNLFADACYYENKSFNTRIFDRPFGAGAGFTFETKQGIFSLHYALGKQFDNPVQLKNGKVHIGYVNYF